MSTIDKREQAKAEIREMIREAVDDARITPEAAEAIETRETDSMEERLATLEATMTPTHDLPGVDDSPEGDEYDFARVYKAIAHGPASYQRYAPMEWDMSEEIRAQGTVDDGAGGFLVPTQTFEGRIEPLMRPREIVKDLGVSEMAASGSPVEIPTETTGPTVDAVAENGTNTATDVAFGNLTATPHTAQSFIKSSRRFLSMGPGAEQFIMQRMAKELAITKNLWVLKGTGASGQPIGILNASGVGTGGQSGFTTATAGRFDAGSYDALLAMELDVSEADAMEGATKLGWAFHPRVKRNLRGMEGENTGAAHIQFPAKVFSAPTEQQVLGYNFKTSTQLVNGASDDGEIIFGDWEQALVVNWGNLSLDASNVAGDANGSAFTQRQTWMVAYLDLDVIVLQPTAFSVVTNADTA